VDRWKESDVVMTPAVAAVIVLLQQVASGALPRAADTVSAADSVRLLRSARAAQASFEVFQRMRLPRGQSHSGPCDVTIGRYCYWRGDGEDDDPAPPEAPAIRLRREQLIRVLDSASRRLPGDAWIAGQRVRYLVETGAHDRARTAAERDCRAAMSWCQELVGFVAHAFEQYGAADSAYGRALDAMSAAERCRRLDISDLIDGDLGKRHDLLDCSGREALTRRATVLGAPLLLVSSTDLLTEHLARLTRARMAEHAATTDGEPWADDARDLVVRYGWPAWYSRSEPPIGSQRTASITGHDTGRPYYFFPSLRVVDHPGDARAGDWRLDDPRAPMGYAPAYARLIHDLPHQVARFRHGDSLLAVAAWDASRDTALARHEIVAALTLTDDARPQPTEATPRSDAGGMLRHIVADSGLISLELLDRKSKHAARARLGFGGPHQRVWLSDLLVFHPWQTGSHPALDSTLAEHAVRSDAVRGSDTVAVYWEAYGLRREPVHFTLAVEQIGVGWMRRAAEALRLADRTTGVRVQWEEVPALVDGIAGRDVRVDLSRLRTGRYRVQLTLLAPGEPAAISTREIQVR
jgi:hypothetical protein